MLLFQQHTLRDFCLLQIIMNTLSHFRAMLFLLHQLYLCNAYVSTNTTPLGRIPNTQTQSSSHHIQRKYLNCLHTRNRWNRSKIMQFHARVPSKNVIQTAASCNRVPCWRTMRNVCFRVKRDHHIIVQLSRECTFREKQLLNKLNCLSYIIVTTNLCVYNQRQFQCRQDKNARKTRQIFANNNCTRNFYLNCRIITCRIYVSHPTITVAQCFSEILFNCRRNCNCILCVCVRDL